MVPAFLAEDRRRCKLKAQPAPALWPGLATLGVGLVLEGAAGAVALLGVPLWVMHSVRGGLRSRPASRMLCLGCAGLVPGLLGLLAARAGLIPPHVEVHLLTMAAMGRLVLAVAARVAMRRSAGAELLPCRRHWGALWLVFSAAAVRGIAELAPQPELWMTLGGIGWSAAWILFLSAHLAALAQPAPFPLLSAARMPQAIS